MLFSKIHYFHGVIPCFVASIMVNFSVFLVLSPSWMSPNKMPVDTSLKMTTVHFWDVQQARGFEPFQVAIDQT